MSEYPDFARIAEGMERMHAAVKRATAQIQRNAMHIYWQNRILFADTEKERRLIRREYARATRRPALIHKGRKP